ncbi:hypothetical protein RclHR1_01620007 [Rhizophagus clarus]|uniref:Uncharacterized protein n=1 Tax=Rhizophagus clarus TaxID=94130 RepID=A0A2Z6QIL1_9GLOM|nr:hypothetical protein RclHR1_01620007 [Rhizophagus clarus]GES87231.1 hypothetical protein GLOIN_2v1525794 [Rhizophagus clarus]
MSMHQLSPFFKEYVKYLQERLSSVEKTSSNDNFIDKLIDKLEIKATSHVDLKYFSKFCQLVAMMSINTYTIYIGAYTSDKTKIDWFVNYFEFYFIVTWIIIWFIYIDFHFRGQKSLEFLIRVMKFISGFSMFLLIYFLRYDMTIYKVKKPIKRFSKQKLPKILYILLTVMMVIILIPIAIIALFVKCRQISTSLEPITSRNVTELFNKDNLLDTIRAIIRFAGFTLNIAYLNKPPNMNSWLETHYIENQKFYNRLIRKKGRWGAIKVMLEYDNAFRLDKKFWKALEG